MIKTICWPFVFFRLTIPVFLTRQIRKKELVPMVEHCAWMVLLLSLQKAGIGFPAYATENVGIWQDVRVKFGNELEIVDTHVITDLPLPDTTSVNFIVQAEIYNSSKTTRTANLHFNIGGLSAVYPVSLNANEKKMIKLDSSRM